VSDVRPILLAAGGTGGHVFPAEALARTLIARGHAVRLRREDMAAGAAGGEQDGTGTTHRMPPLPACRRVRASTMPMP
jgi:hypothetical protein